MGCGGSKDEKKPKEGSVKSDKKAASGKKTASDKKASSTKKISPPQSAKNQVEDHPDKGPALEPGSVHSATGVTKSHASSPAGSDVDAPTAPQDTAEYPVEDAASVHQDNEQDGEDAPQTRAVHSADTANAVPLSAHRESPFVAHRIAPGTPRKAVPDSVYQRKMWLAEQASQPATSEAPSKSPRVIKPMPLRCRNTRVSVAKQRRMNLVDHHDDPNEYKQLS